MHEFLPSIGQERRILKDFIERHGLKYEDDIEFAVGFSENDRLIACGCCSGSLLKSFVVEEQFRGQNILSRIVSGLVANRFSLGYFDLIVITRPINKKIFNSSGFYTVAETEDLIFLEHRADGIKRFVSELYNAEYSDKEAAAIVVNCNPFTRGHRYIVEYASSQSKALHVFVVEEDKSEFPFDVRMDLVKKGVADLSNVYVHAGGKYIISSATFPSYFLKKDDDIVKIQAKLDATIFASHIAPPLNIKKRYVGSEPLCPVTSQYNKILKEVLPPKGIDVIEIPRHSTDNGEVISASRVRRVLAEGKINKSLLKLVPSSTYEYLISTDARKTLDKLRE